MGTLQRDQGSLAGVTSAGPWGGISGNAFTPWALPSAAPHAGCEHSRREDPGERAVEWGPALPTVQVLHLLPASRRPWISL